MSKSANLEPSVVQELDRSGLQSPGVAGGVAEAQREVAASRRELGHVFVDVNDAPIL